MLGAQDFPVPNQEPIPAAITVHINAQQEEREKREAGRSLTCMSAIAQKGGRRRGR